MIEVYSWNSYSCNNSSDIRLVATFESSSEASAMLERLREFFRAHGREHDQKLDDDVFEWPGGVTDAAVAFGRQHDHQWSEILIWGDEGLGGDEPRGTVLGNSLVLYHTYTSTFGADLPEVLRHAGATAVVEDDGPPVIYAELTFGDGPLRDELASMFEQRHGTPMYEWVLPWPLEGEIGGNKADATYLADGDRCCFTLPLPVAEFEGFFAYLEGRGAREIKLELADGQRIESNRAQEAARARAGASRVVGQPFDPAGLSFVIAGRLAAVNRKQALARLASIGGTLAEEVTRDLDVLVIGEVGSALFGEGDKVGEQLAAESLNREGASIRIISESLFLQLGG